MQTQDDAGVVFLGVHHLFVVGVAQKGQRRPIGAQGRFHHIGQVALVGFRVKIFQRLAGGVLMLGQVVIGAVGYAPQFAPAKGEQELEIGSRLGIEGQFLRLVVAQAKVFLLHPQI